MLFSVALPFEGFYTDVLLLLISLLEPPIQPYETVLYPIQVVHHAISLRHDLKAKSSNVPADSLVGVWVWMMEVAQLVSLLQAATLQSLVPRKTPLPVLQH